MTSLIAKVLKGSLLSFAIKFAQKSLGLISTLVLARLLTPEDFGIVAIAALALHFFDVLSTAGSDQYLIHKFDVEESDINSSWTLNFILKLILFLVFLAVVPLISEFYEDTRLNDVLSVSAIVLLFNAVKSPGIALLKKELEYKKIFILNIAQKLTVFTFVLVWAFIQPSYWVLIWGDVVSALFLAVGSYFIHPHRPRLCTLKIREQFNFSKWILLKGGVGYARAQMDVFFVAKYYSAGLVGTYHLARQLALMPSTDIVEPAIEPLLSSFSKVKNDITRLRNQFRISFLIVCSLIVPVAIFMYTYPDLIIGVLLGEQWQQAHTILSSLTILLVAFIINQLVTIFCVSMGQVKTIFYYDLVSTLIIFLGLYYFSELSLHNFALLRGVLAVAPLAVMLFYICRSVGLSFINLILNLTILFSISLISIKLVSFIHQYYDSNVFFDLIISSVIFFGTFTCLMYTLTKSALKKFYEWKKLDELILSAINSRRAK